MKNFSTLGTKIPAKYYFNSGLLFTALIAFVTYWCWFAVRDQVAEQLSDDENAAASDLLRLSRFMAYTSCIMLSVVPAFRASVDEVPRLHNAFKFILFFTSLAHMCLNLIDRWSEVHLRPWVWFAEFLVFTGTGLAFITVQTMFFVDLKAETFVTFESAASMDDVMFTEMLFEYVVFGGILLHILLMTADLRLYGLHWYQLTRKTTGLLHNPADQSDKQLV
ncbi:hypothetical protein PHET_02472 [Paragonimus heterotremus]|uniref:Uncharacterized protein n=1 Tax=Paragonimus heterotremus TaxID=100268 RepID=A0A8J4SS03_9TREM|nr:hypothetical protein PHET_02472 [Paragonimus heterotremus]